jgi:hypothetical protein
MRLACQQIFPLGLIFSFQFPRNDDLHFGSLPLASCCLCRPLSPATPPMIGGGLVVDELSPPSTFPCCEFQPLKWRNVPASVEPKFEPSRNHSLWPNCFQPASRRSAVLGRNELDAHNQFDARLMLTCLPFSPCQACSIGAPILQRLTTCGRLLSVRAERDPSFAAGSRWMSPRQIFLSN